MNNRTKYLQAAVALAERSASSKFTASLQAYFSEAQRWIRKSELQQKGSLRLLRLGGALQ